jgi:outer membrane immunogenic protein
MPLKAPMPAPVMSWTGCYVDGGWGYGMWNQDHYTRDGAVTVSGTTTDGGRGWLGRFGGGCDYQFGQRYVVGVLADYDFMGLKGTATQDLTGTATPFFGVAGTEKETSAWYVGPRFGYLVTPRLMTYFDGGYTATRFSSVNFATNDPGGAFAIGANTGLSMPATTYHGWFLGGGTEYALDFDWLPIHGLFWRNEYRYASYSGRDITDSCSGGGAPCGAAGVTPVSEHASKQVQTITSSLVWRFNMWH